VGYVEDFVEPRTKLGAFFSILFSMDDSTDNPMPIIRHIDDQPRQIHPG
jgi:hypothetical protein